MWNDRETDIDLLGNDKIAQTIIEIVNDNHLRPLTIGIYGDWGVGKSSILSLLQKNINAQNEKGIIKSHSIIFNGWLFQGYEDARSALMETIISELADLQPTHKKVQSLAKSLFKRVNWLKVAKVSASAIWTGVTGLPNPAMLHGLVGLAQKAKDLISEKQEPGTNVTVEAPDDESFLKEAEKETVPSQIHAFRKEFEELIKESKIDQLIVLVDDLDRCLPKSVIETLEAIRLFLFVQGTVFVISADERMIEYSVREHFPNLPASYSDYTKNYLEKLIQIPIRIPTLNRLQTGNYIKFLMLQFHLKHDYSELNRIYQIFEAKKKTPYENINLTYDMIAKGFSNPSQDLKDTLLVADQISPMLAIGLKGNPRNIKRFLNTLFLRIRIAKIYGLDQVIKLNVLAKLMLLERFQADKFENIVMEVSLSEKGLASSLQKNAEEKPVKGKAKFVSQSQNVEQNDSIYFNWTQLEPELNDIDLRPYIFISKEKAIGFDKDDALPQRLNELYDQLESGSSISLNDASKRLKEVGLEDAKLLFEKLEIRCRATDNLKTIPSSMKGLLRIIQVHTSLEDRLLDLLESYPAKGLGPWAVTEFSGLKTSAKQRFDGILTTWSKQPENNILRSTSTQALNK